MISPKLAKASSTGSTLGSSTMKSVNNFVPSIIVTSVSGLP
jgi:hypothetical protein